MLSGWVVAILDGHIEQFRCAAPGSSSPTVTPCVWSSSTAGSPMLVWWKKTLWALRETAYCMLHDKPIAVKARCTGHAESAAGRCVGESHDVSETACRLCRTCGGRDRAVKPGQPGLLVRLVPVHEHRRRAAPAQIRGFLNAAGMMAAPVLR